MIDTSVVDATTLTDNSTSRLNFDANIVVVAAVGAELAITNAITISLSSLKTDNMSVTAIGIITSLAPIAR